jgi:uncharacterized membrane protein YwzB
MHHGLGHLAFIRHVHIHVHVHVHCCCGYYTGLQAFKNFCFKSFSFTSLLFASYRFIFVSLLFAYHICFASKYKRI